MINSKRNNTSDSCQIDLVKIVHINQQGIKMTIKSIILTGLLGLALTSTLSAKDFKTNSCNIAETAFWDAYKKAYDSSDHSFIDALQESDKIAYFNLHKGELHKKMQEVEHRCSKIDEVLASAYSKKIEELQNELNKL